MVYLLRINYYYLYYIILINILIQILIYLFQLFYVAGSADNFFTLENNVLIFSQYNEMYL